jgi:PAS domain S-box-containing protein
MTSSPDSRTGPYSPETDTDPGRDEYDQLIARLEMYQKTLKDIYERYDQKIEELSLIRRIGDSVKNPLELEDLCHGILDTVAHEIAADRLAILLINQSQRHLLVRALYEAAADETVFFSEDNTRSYSLNDDNFRQVLAGKTPVRLTTKRSEEDPFHDGSSLPVSLALLPLIARDKTVGLFYLSRSEQHPFDDNEIRILSIISDQAATALANVQLFNELAAANIGLRDSERQARQTSLYLQSLLEAANDVIFTLDETGSITYVNRKVEDWGYDRARLMGRGIDELTVDASAALEMKQRLLAPRNDAAEIGFRTGDGSRRDTLVSTSYLGGRLDGGSNFLLLARDITERKQLERQLFHSEKLASIGILAAGVAHEIGNPLSAISGYTQILQSGYTSEEDTREYLAAIESQTARIQKIIQDLLNYSRPATGLRSELDLKEALPAIMTMMTSQKTFRHITVTYDLPDNIPPIVMDRDHLAQVVVNIALNAAQAMSEGGTFTISVRHDNDNMTIHFTDTGPGVPPEAARRIFDPFFTTKPSGQGTGLGLAICHRIIENYHGDLSLTANPGPGATFVVRLPTAQGKDKAHALGATHPGG